MSELRQAVTPGRSDLVWSYRHPGYPVLKKWLSYRESKVLRRGLEVGEIGWFSEVARRVHTIIESTETRT